MESSLLLVEDEAGIREGLSAFLQLKGHRVVTAATCAEGLELLAREDFDLVITDWRLGDGLGADIVEASSGPVLIASGVPEDVDMSLDRVEVIRKPVMPQDLLARVQALVGGVGTMEPRERATGSAPSSAFPPDLPVDARDLVDLVFALVAPYAKDPGGRSSVVDDGKYITLEIYLDRDDENLITELRQVLSDVRILEREGRGLLQARFSRNGQPDGVEVVIGPDDDWPSGEGPFAVDFHRSAGVSPARLLTLLAAARHRNEVGGTVHFLNVPSHLRLYLEVLGKAHDMPIRYVVGPRLPEVLEELWR